MVTEVIQQLIKAVPWRWRSKIRQIPGLAILQRKLLSQFVEGKEFIHTVDAGPANGLIIPVILPDDKGIWTGTYELDFVQSLANAVAPDDVCFDVGGWHGYCGGTMAVQGASQVTIFEPLPDNIQRIRRVQQLNARLPIRLVEAAVADEPGTACFDIMPETSMGKLSTSNFQPDASSASSVEVQVISLDNWCTEENQQFPDLMKIDVEGAEMQVLQGAAKILHEKRPKLFVETHSRQLTRETYQHLVAIGYSVNTLQTGMAPDGISEPEVCHLVAKA